MFSRPVDPTYQISRHYGEKDKKYDWMIDPDNGLWIPIRDRDGKGQHRGIDFDCPKGTIVRAMADGIIIRARFENAVNTKLGAGLYITQLVMYPGFDSWALKYCHLKAIYVDVGKRVCRHDAMAESGDSGNADSAYLHVEIMNLTRQWRPIPLESNG